MKELLVDLHIHTCLSPCGSLDMSPEVIVRNSLRKGLSAIAVTDHNTTLQCPEIQRLGEENGLKVFAGVEVNTGEEVHCLVLFRDEGSRILFQQYLDRHLPEIPNDPERFGDQVWVNSREEIMGEAPYLLISAINRSIDDVASFAKSMDCIFVPAHVERPVNGIVSQLGFMDTSLPANAVEYNDKKRYEQLLKAHPYFRRYTQYTASDAHSPEQIGMNPSIWRTSSCTFEHLHMAMAGANEHTLRALQ